MCDTGEISLGPAIPELPVRDAPATIEYYERVLGFRVKWDDAELGFEHTMYACLTRGELELVINEHRAAEVGTMVCVVSYVSSVDALCDDLRGRGARIVQPPTDQPWRERTLVVEDSNGHRLNFSQILRR